MEDYIHPKKDSKQSLKSIIILARLIQKGWIFEHFITTHTLEQNLFWNSIIFLEKKSSKPQVPKMELLQLDWLLPQHGHYTFFRNKLAYKNTSGMILSHCNVYISQRELLDTPVLLQHLLVSNKTVYYIANIERLVFFWLYWRCIMYFNTPQKLYMYCAKDLPFSPALILPRSIVVTIRKR